MSNHWIVTRKCRILAEDMFALYGGKKRTDELFGEIRKYVYAHRCYLSNMNWAVTYNDMIDCEIIGTWVGCGSVKGHSVRKAGC